MGLPKGRTNNPKGRPPGSMNKICPPLRSEISNFLETNFEAVIREWKKVKGKEKLQFYRDLLPFAIPRMQAITNEIDLDNLSDEQLNRLFNRVINKIEQDHEPTG